MLPGTLERSGHFVRNDINKANRCYPKRLGTAKASLVQGIQKWGKIVSVVLAVAILASVFLIQALHTFETGVVAAFFITKNISHSGRPRLRHRAAYALLYGAVGVFLLGILVRLAVNSVALRARIMNHLGTALLVWALAVGGIWSVLYPVGLLTWAREAHPDLDVENRMALGIARIIGVGFLVIAFWAISFL